MWLYSVLTSGGYLAGAASLWFLGKGFLTFMRGTIERDQSDYLSKLNSRGKRLVWAKAVVRQRMGISSMLIGVAILGSYLTLWPDKVTSAQWAGVKLEMLRWADGRYDYRPLPEQSK